MTHTSPRSAAQVVEALATSDVLLFTSRTLVRGGDADDSLAISRNVSTAVIEVVRAALAAHPSWVVAKGGITSHDVAVRGLGIRRAEVLGQLLPGMVSVFRPDRGQPRRPSAPPTSSSPATSATTTPWPTSSTSSPAAADPTAAPSTPALHEQGAQEHDDRRMDRTRRHGRPHGGLCRPGRAPVTAFDIDPQKAVALAADGVKPGRHRRRRSRRRRCAGADGRHRRAGRIRAVRRRARPPPR